MDHEVHLGSHTALWVLFYELQMVLRCEIFQVPNLLFGNFWRKQQIHHL